MRFNDHGMRQLDGQAPTETRFALFGGGRKLKRQTAIIWTVPVALALFGHAAAQTPYVIHEGQAAPYPEAPVCEEACVDTGGAFGGADFLWIRPRFSEAFAFARGVNTGASYETEGVELDFEHDASFRGFIGYAWGPCDESIQLTYWHLEGDVRVNGNAPGPGEFIIDPFGNGVGTIIVIDPNSALFGQQLPAGDSIRTRAEVTTDIYDFDWKKPLSLDNPRWHIAGKFGLRLADIEQYYESVVMDGGSLFAEGQFAAEFFGVGPRVGLEGRRHFGHGGRFSLFATSNVSLLVGEYDEVFSNETTVPAPFRTSQEASLDRTLAVLEAELGASWTAGGFLRLSVGYLWQSWFDLGASGGTFGGFFVGADDANIMSFDGASLRAEFSF